MLASFTAGWYWSIASMLRSRKPYGKSAPFVACTVTGYVFGLTAKLLAWQQGGVLSDVAFVYIWNLTLTAIDLILVVHFSRQQNDCSAADSTRTSEQPCSLRREKGHPTTAALRQQRISAAEVHGTAPLRIAGDAQRAITEPCAQMIVAPTSPQSVNHARAAKTKTPAQE